MPYRVLIVEDHPFQHHHLAHLFRLAGGFEVEVQADGERAINRMHSQAYDLVITDLMMPHLDGVQLIQKLACLPNPPALALMTAASPRMLAGAGRVAENLGLRVAGLITKPVQVQHIHALRQHLHTASGQSLQPVAPRKWHSAETLTEALHKGQIQAWFQPKKSLLDGRIVGAEALARWRHADEGVLLPSAFLPELQAAGLDMQLLRSMLEQTLAAQTLWAQHGYTLPVSINLPTHLLDHPHLVDTLHDDVRRRDADPRSITFELSEASTTQRSSDYFAGTCRLRMLGFGLAQDDFAKGYSSYFNLVATPFTEMKIDRSLVNGCALQPDIAIALTSAVRLGRALGLITVAEGVETREELEVVRRAECDQVQGFIIAPAVEPGRMLSLLER